MKTFNKKGDSGETSLLFGQRVPKSDLHCEAYGTIDEAMSSLGIARNHVKKERTRDIILRIQKELFALNAELAIKPQDCDRLAARFDRLTNNMVNSLENTIVAIEAEVEPPKSFIVPGSNLASATLDMTRAIVRRAERRVVTLKENGELGNDAVLRYLNRLADLLFILARYEEV